MFRLRAIILNYNRSSLTGECVRSVLEQEYRPLDIVVVDNHSDHEEYQRLVKSIPHGVSVVRCSENLGYAAGNNQGILFDGFPIPKYVAIINNDVFFPSHGILKELVDALESDSQRAACSPLVDTLSTRLPPQMQIQVRRVPGYLMLLVGDSWWLRRLPGLRRLARSYSYADQRPYPHGIEIECETINGSCWVVRKDVLDRIGNLDEGTFLYQEEIILGRQVQELGLKNCLVTSSLVRHYQGGTSGQRGGRIAVGPFWQMVRSEGHYCRKYLGVSSVGIAALYAVRALDISSKVLIRKVQALVA